MGWYVYHATSSTNSPYPFTRLGVVKCYLWAFFASESPSVWLKLESSKATFLSSSFFWYLLKQIYPAKPIIIMAVIIKTADINDETLDYSSITLGSKLVVVVA